MEEMIRIAIIALVCIPVGVLLGNSAVYVFNNMPARWLCDYEEEPSDEKFIPGRQRMNSHPWKLTFSAMFAAMAIFLCYRDILYAVTAIAQLWLLLIIAVSDRKYSIIPDQFVIFLALSSIGFSYHFGDIKGMILGALMGGGAMLLVALTGRLVTKQEALGFGDVKLMAAIGLTAGIYGSAFVLVVSSFLSGAVFTYKIVRKQIKRGEMQPLGPYIAFATALFLMGSV